MKIKKFDKYLNEDKIDSNPFLDKKTKLFFDTEFTGLVKDTTLISIGIITENDDVFYAEFTDYNKDLVDEWIQENVIDKLILPKKEGVYENGIVGDKNFISSELKKWLSDKGEVVFWSDCLSYDWVLLNDLFGGALSKPDNVYYIPMDICTLFAEKNIDPDISREEFSEYENKDEKHNALFDAKIIKMCFDKLKKIN